MSIIASSASGLSPLTRGTHMNVGSDRVFTRFIPAGAGNTRRRLHPSHNAAVYPRWRGEHCQRVGVRFALPGLSPPTRGTRCCCVRYYFIPRLIPADAGNTRIDSCAIPAGIGLSPLDAGSTWPVPGSFSSLLGLSPLTRGTPRQLFRPLHGMRFIPADAGNTDSPQVRKTQ